MEGMAGGSMVTSARWVEAGDTVGQQAGAREHRRSNHGFVSIRERLCL